LVDDLPGFFSDFLSDLISYFFSDFYFFSTDLPTDFCLLAGDLDFFLFLGLSLVGDFSFKAATGLVF